MPRPGVGQGLPPATVEAPEPPAEDADAPLCAKCGHRHPTPGGQAVVARLRLGVGPPTPVDPRAAGIPGWGRNRNRGGDCW